MRSSKLFSCAAGVLLLLGCSKNPASSASSPSVPIDGPHPLAPGSERPKNPTCLAPSRPAAAVELERVFGNLDVEAPVGLVQASKQAGEQSGRWYLIEQRGRVRSFFTDTSGNTTNLVTTNLTSRVAAPENLDERGLLGIALHPRFPADPRVFLVFTASSGGHVNQLSSFLVQNGALDLASEVSILVVPQPYTNHNGGGIVFGPDGYLYYGLGDGGSRADPLGHGQNTQTLLGAMLRLDVDNPSGGRAYGIPTDNPFADGVDGLPELYAYGLRNPWRFSFDRDTGELWAGDVGQNHWEEIDVIERGGNYGWNVREGEVCFPIGTPDCQSAGLIPPVHVYRNPDNGSRSVTGGYVYRGTALPDLLGHYLFADYVTGQLWSLSPAADGRKVKELSQTGLAISSFAEDQDGELYLLDHAEGRVFKIGRSSGAAGQGALPRLLSQTGCVNPEDPRQVTSAAVPYQVALPFWSDGAEKDRYLALPDATQIHVLPDGDFELPPGAVLLKNFRLGERLIETRFYVRHADGEYSGYTYAWRQDGSDAELVEETRTEPVGGVNWVYPGRDACNQCHTAASGRTLGLELEQLDLVHSEVGVNQLEALYRLGMLDSDRRSAATFPRFSDESASLDVRARAYLHVNCGSCHRPGGPGRGGFDLRFSLGLAETGLCGNASLGNLGTASGRLLAPGARDQSVLYLRSSRRDSDGMPPVASNQVDTLGVELLGAWIDALSGCL